MTTTEGLTVADLATIKALYTVTPDCVEWHQEMVEGAVWVPALVDEVERGIAAQAAQLDMIARLARAVEENSTDRSDLALVAEARGQLDGMSHLDQPKLLSERAWDVVWDNPNAPVSAQVAAVRSTYPDGAAPSPTMVRGAIRSAKARLPLVSFGRGR